LYNTLVSGLGRFFTSYIEGMTSFVEKDLHIEQYMAILSNSTFIVQQIFPITQSQVTERFERVIPELEKQMTELGGNYLLFNLKMLWD
jgi:hypothetical protein